MFWIFYWIIIAFSNHILMFNFFLDQPGGLYEEE